MNSALILRTFPDTENEFLRFQYGIMEPKSEENPIYDENSKLVGYRKSARRGSAYRLLGYGSSEINALKMTLRKKWNE